MKTRTLALMLGCLGMAGLSSDVSTAPILDQSFLGGVGSVSGEAPFAQTFTVGIAGRLRSVDVRIFGDVDVTVDIRGTILGVPLTSNDRGDQLGRLTVTPPRFPSSLVSVDLRHFNIDVTPGDLLAIVLHGQGIHNWIVAQNADATYPGGEAFLMPGADWQALPAAFPTITQADFQFQTFVPEPATVPLLVLGSVSLLAYRRSVNRAVSPRPQST